jgi:glycosyltransferase involved in cell wall biosynthesis
MKTPRVAFTLIGGRNWTGGYNYLLNLLRILGQESVGDLQPVLFSGTDVPAADLAPFQAIPGCEIVTDSAFDDRARPRALVRALTLGLDPATWAALHEARVDLAFESAVFLGWRLPLPAIAWIPDLQHRFMPPLFSRSAWWKRELGFQAQIRAGRMVMCSSEDTREAFERLYPACRGRVQAVRFAVRAPAMLPQQAAQEAARRHGMPDQFFFMPNQFWVHKNHRLVVDALERLRSQGREITVLASGQQRDPRNEAHGPALLAHVRAAGLQDRFVAPGLLPYADLAPLLQASTALLNPSSFEGWSTTVEEARAMGVPMLLSDIAVHREQAKDLAQFFDPGSAQDLARALAQFEPLSAAERLVRQQTAVTRASQRVARFAGDFTELVMRTLQGTREKR